MSTGRGDTLKNRNRFAAGFAALAFVLVGLVAQQGDVSAASLSARIEVKVTGTLTNILDLAEASAPLTALRAQAFANGVGANQANVIWSDRRTLGSGVTEDLDFVGGGLTDAFGVAVAPAKIRALIISSATSNTVNLTLFGDAASILFLSTAGSTMTLRPGGIFVFTAPDLAGVTVTGATSDIIQVANGAASSTYDIIVIGTSS
jgi:hypothetical protein